MTQKHDNTAFIYSSNFHYFHCYSVFYCTFLILCTNIFLFSLIQKRRENLTYYKGSVSRTVRHMEVLLSVSECCFEVVSAEMSILELLIIISPEALVYCFRLLCILYK